MPKTPPAGENQTVATRRRTNAEVRPREYLTDAEVDQLLVAARKRGGRYGHRDATMILLTYLHGLRVSEVCALRWDQVDTRQGHLHVVRRKGSKPAVHTLRGSEIRALRRLAREQSPASPFVFTTERQGPMTTEGFRKLISRVCAFRRNVITESGGT